MTDKQCVDYILLGYRLYWDMLGKMRGNGNHKGNVCWLTGDVNYSYDIKLEGCDYNEQIKNVIQRIKNKELPNNITILPDSAPTGVDLLDTLIKTNLFKLGYTSLGMAKILHPELEFPKADKRLNIYHVKDLYQLKMSGAILNAAFEYDLFSFEHYLDAFNMHQVSIYLAEFDGVPVGACLSISHNEVMEIAWVAVLPGYRKKGIAGNLINEAERDAAQNEKTISVLCSFEGAVNAYQRIGYKAYCKIDVVNYIDT